MLTKRPPVATTVPSGMNTVIGHWYTSVYLRIYDPSPSNPTTFPSSAVQVTIGNPLFPVGVRAFNFTEKALIFAICDYIFRLRQKRCEI